jgi:hypothetical protein
METLPDEVASGREAPTRIAAGLALAALLIAGVGWLDQDELFGIGPTAIHDPAGLPDHVSSCAGSFDRTPSSHTLAEIQVFGSVARVIDPAPLAPCPPGPRPTAVYVRVGQDAYREYVAHPQDGCGGG